MSMKVHLDSCISACSARITFAPHRWRLHSLCSSCAPVACKSLRPGERYRAKPVQTPPITGRIMSCSLLISSEDEPMLKAVVSRGEIRPLEPLPVDWQEGQALRVEKADVGEMPIEEIDCDFAVLANLCAAREQADEEQLERALREARH
jgi:hypothetical protein